MKTMELDDELVRSLLELPCLVGWQVGLGEAYLAGNHDTAEELAEVVQGRWRELMERGAV